MDKHSHEIFKNNEVGFCWMVLLLAVALLLAGCGTTVKHEVPQLDGVSDAMRKIVIKDCAPQVPAPTLKMTPIGTDVVIDIKGDMVTANEGGIALLRDYVKAQRILEPK